MLIASGDAGPSGSSGTVTFQTGASANFAVGSIVFATGGGFEAGDITLSTGDVSVGNAGDITVCAGATAALPAVEGEQVPSGGYVRWGPRMPRGPGSKQREDHAVLESKKLCGK